MRARRLARLLAHIGQAREISPEKELLLPKRTWPLCGSDEQGGLNDQENFACTKNIFIIIFLGSLIIILY